MNIFQEWVRKYDPDFNNKILLAAIAGFVILLLSNGQAIIGAYTPDDYSALAFYHPPAFFLQQGRYMQALHVIVTDALGINISDAGVAAWLILFCILSICTAYFIDTIVRKDTPVTYLFIPVSLILSSPYLATLFIYRRAIIPFTISYLFLTLFIISYRAVIRSINIKNVSCAGLFLSFSLGAYQPILPVAVMLAGWSMYYTKKNISFSLIFSRFFPILLGLGIYLVVYSLTKSLDGPGWDARGGLLPLSEFSSRLSAVLHQLKIMFVGEYFILGRLYSSLIFYTALVALLTIVIYCRKKIRPILFAVTSILVIIFPVAVLHQWDPTTRALSSFPFLYGIIIALCLDYLSKNNIKIIKNILLLMSIICIYFGILISESFYLKMERINTSDRFAASSITRDYLKINPAPSKVFVIFDHNGPLKTVEWALRGVFYAATGHLIPFASPSGLDKEKCTNSPKWPNYGYILTEGDVMYICVN